MSRTIDFEDHRIGDAQETDRRAFLCAVALFAGCASAPEPADERRFSPTWESIRSHQVPEWFHDAKLGIMVCWGLYSVPAWATPTGELGKIDWSVWFQRNPYAEWYWNTLKIDGSPTQQHHSATYGKDFRYLDFIPQFNEAAKSWNPEQMASQLADAGAQYVVLVSKFHDGFPLWPTEVTNPHRGPDQQHADRDIVGDLTNAVRARGLQMGLYYSGGLDWSFKETPIRVREDVSGTIPHTDDYAEYVDAQWRELIDRYEPNVLWNDIGYPKQGDLANLFADYYERFPDGLINNRFETRLPEGPERHHDFVTPEYAQMDDITDQKWETCRGLGFSFGYNQVEGPEHTLSAEALIHLLVDIVSKNGNLLLNVGPRADGSIPEIQLERLRELGRWLSVNGEAIYGSRPWQRAEGTTAGGLDVRFTRKEDAIYAVLLGRPATAEVTLESVPVGPGGSVSLLGGSGALRHRSEGGNLVVTLPVELPQAHAYTLKIASMGGSR